MHTSRTTNTLLNTTQICILYGFIFPYVKQLKQSVNNRDDYEINFKYERRYNYRIFNTKADDDAFSIASHPQYSFISKKPVLKCFLFVFSLILRYT